MGIARASAPSRDKRAYGRRFPAPKVSTAGQPLPWLAQMPSLAFALLESPFKPMLSTKKKIKSNHALHVFYPTAVKASLPCSLRSLSTSEALCVILRALTWVARACMAVLG